MHQFRNVLVGVDLASADRLAASELNPPTLEALSRALWFAEQTKAELTFFSALELSAQTQELLGNEPQGGLQTVMQAADDVLAELVGRAQERGISARRKLVVGRGWQEMIRQVLRDKHDLVIVGTRDLGAAERLLLGSTAMKLLRKCPCPVWVVKPDSMPEDVNILVASDLSEVAEDALQLAVSCAQLVDAKLHIVHAIEYQFDHQMLRTGISEDAIAKHHAQLHQQAETKIQEQLSQTDFRTLTYGVQIHIVRGPADVVILDAIQEHGIDLLMMGTVARGGIPGLLIGNTAERLLSQVPCSVLAVKPADFQTPVTLE